ncbi:MAG: amidohydrolase family protein, partial [Anaerolineales bacterium]|nr:amidohydrolase family protein [Anaerolineales bacterium]
MEQVDLLILNASQVCVIPSEHGGPQRGSGLGELGLVENGAVAVKNGRIHHTGPTTDLQTRYTAVQTIDANGRAVIPGFVDPHTHLPWFGDRAHEFEMRLAGASYMEIMAAGGGIMNTVRQARQASIDDLVADNLPRLQRMLAHGTTSTEAKTGYGLDTATEIKLLDAMLALHAVQPVEITPTFLPAHAVPAEYQGRTNEYVDLVINDMLPAGAEWMTQHHIQLFFDVFCEAGVFDVPQTRRMMETAVTLGYRLKIHADEFEGLGGTKLAVELGAVS